MTTKTNRPKKTVEMKGAPPPVATSDSNATKPASVDSISGTSTGTEKHPARKQLTAAETLRMSNWLHAEKVSTVGKESLAEAIGRLSVLAQQGNEDAAKMLVGAGSHIASSLFIVWTGPNCTEGRNILRKIAADESCFPVCYHSQEHHNIGWRRMVAELGIGANCAVRTDGNQRSEPDVVDAVIDGGIRTLELCKKLGPSFALPDELKGAVELGLVAENAGALASYFAQFYESSDPGFTELSSARPLIFSCLGRHFKKRKDKAKASLRKKRERSHTKETTLKPWSEEKTRRWQKDDDAFWRSLEEKKLAMMKQTAADIKADLVEAITSRLRSRLKSSPEK
jgi:hypothetical protein